MLDAIRVLYVDDETGLLEIGKLFLEESGDFSVTTIDSATAALRLLEKENFDAIVSDYQIPGMDGIEFLIEIRARFGEIPFIIFTGKGREEVVIQSINNGADFYLQKGGEPESQFAELAHKIHAAVSRKKAEDKLRESEAQKTAILDGITANIAFVDKDLKILWANKAAAKSVNKSPAEMIGHTCHAFWADPAHPCVNCPTIKVFETKQSEHTIMHTPDGRVWDERDEPVFDEQGNLIGVVEIDQDITKRKRVEEALLESEEKFRNILNLINDGVQINEIDPEGKPGKFIEINNVACQMLKYTREELLEHGPLDFVTDYHNRPLNEILTELFSTGHSIFETEHRKKDGTIFPVEINANVVNLLGKKVVVSVIRDITERQRAEEAMQEINELYSKFFSRSPIYAYIKTVMPTQSRVIQASDNFHEMIGISGKDMVGKTMTDLFPPELAEKFTADDWNVVSNCKVLNLEENFNYRNYITIKFPIVLKDKNLLAGYTLDITERKQAEDALHQANKKLNLLSEITRHDIKNKIMTIQGFLRFTRKLQDIDKIQSSLENIHELTKAVEHQIDFTKDYQDQGVKSPRWLNLSNMIILASNPAIQIINETGILQIFADPLFEKVMHNLTDNTIRHGETATEVHVSVLKKQDNIRIIWRDNGIGVQAEEKDKIFQRGYGKHTGFGLFLIKEILAITGIAIQENGEPGKGARFEITVPNGNWRYGNE